VRVLEKCPCETVLSRSKNTVVDGDLRAACRNGGRGKDRDKPRPYKNHAL
jgi:hypothetical protein